MRCAWTAILSCLLVIGCSVRAEREPRVAFDGGAEEDAALPEAPDTGVDEGDATEPSDVGPIDAAACATATAAVTVVRKPVDIIWVIDNSASMEPAIAEVQLGLGEFARLVASRDIDYRVIMVSKRGVGRYRASFTENWRYAVCIPRPLAGDADCGDGARFFHESVDIRSTQPLEQLLGSLDETTGYAPGDDYGADPGEISWGRHLRRDATKTIVVVTDDNARMVTAGYGKPRNGDDDPSASPTATATWFERMPGGLNPFNGTGSTATRALPPGLLAPSRGGLFEGYSFNGIYGWGSTTDDEIACEYPGGDEASSAGRTYSALVARTHGVRARLCDGHDAWTSFFEEVASAVVARSRISCELPMPTPPAGTMFSPGEINVVMRGASGAITLPKAPAAAACSGSVAWHYDNEDAPTQVVLCPAACDLAQTELRDEDDQVSVEFGCESILI